MKPVVKFVFLILFTLLVFAPLHPAAASGPLDGRVIFGQLFTLRSGETMEGDLVIFGGSAIIEEGAVVKGNTMLFGGNLTLDGEVTGDVAIMGGLVILGPRSHLYGNLTTLGATINRFEGSLVDGQITNAGTSWMKGGVNGASPFPPETQPTVPAPGFNVDFHPLNSIMSTFGQAFGLAILAMLVMLFLAPHADRVAHAIIAQPLTAGGLGLLTVVVAPVVFVALVFISILIVTAIVTVPLIILLAIALGMAELFGWIAIGYEIGQRLTRAVHQEWHPAFSAGIGTFLLTIIANGASVLNFVPGLQCVTWILPAVVGMFALGAVVMTRFGTEEVTAPVVKSTVKPVDSQG